MLKANIAQLLDKEMDRTDFLKHVGIGIVALTGASAILKTLVAQPTSSSRGLLGAAQSAGYGSTTYGGGKTSS